MNGRYVDRWGRHPLADPSRRGPRGSDEFKPRGDRERALALGAGAFYPKPKGIDDLYPVVEAMIGGRPAGPSG